MGICDSSKNKGNEVMVDPKNPSRGLDQYMANVSKSLCKIRYENQSAIGFLIKLFKGQKEFFCMMTCEHVITREMIQQRKTISFYYDSIDVKTIGLN